VREWDLDNISNECAFFNREATTSYLKGKNAKTR
jgi:hypothetical protein